MRGNVRAAALAALITVAVAGPAAAAGCNLQNLGEWPLVMTNRAAVATAQINGVSARLFIDTGSFFSTLGPQSAQRFKLRGWDDTGLHVQGVTGAIRTRLVVASTFMVGGATYRNFEFLVGEHDFGSGDGLIGQNLLSNADVEYDFANGVMRLFHPDGCGSASLAYWARDTPVRMLPIDPITTTENQIHAVAMVNGQRIRVVLDTGASNSVLTLAAARRIGLRTDAPGVIATGNASGVGARLIASYSMPIASFSIGGENINDTRLRVAALDMQDVDMLLGVDFFLSHRVLVSRSENRVYFTYNGGPVFDAAHEFDTTTAAPYPSPVAGDSPMLSDAPTDAPGYVRRASAFMTRSQFSEAIADYTSAIGLTPNDAALYTDRGLAYLRNRQPLKALDDFNQTIKLHPDAPRALLARGELRLAARDADGARADFAAALKITPEAGGVVGDAYGRAGLWADAVVAFDTALAGQTVGENQAALLLARCRVRTFGNLELDKAVDDCTTAMRLRPGAAAPLQLRGLAYLRQDKLDLALADFNAALKLQPNDPMSLYARGLAETRKGDHDAGAADLAKANALDPKLADRLKALGLTS